MMRFLPLLLLFLPALAWAPLPDPSCSKDSDCILAPPKTCGCPCSAGGSLIAIHTSVQQRYKQEARKYKKDICGKKPLAVCQNQYNCGSFEAKCVNSRCAAADAKITKDRPILSLRPEPIRIVGGGGILPRSVDRHIAAERERERERAEAAANARAASSFAGMHAGPADRPGLSAEKAESAHQKAKKQKNFLNLAAASNGAAAIYLFNHFTKLVTACKAKCDAEAAAAAAAVGAGTAWSAKKLAACKAKCPQTHKQWAILSGAAGAQAGIMLWQGKKMGKLAGDLGGLKEDIEDHNKPPEGIPAKHWPPVPLYGAENCQNGRWTGAGLTDFSGRPAEQSSAALSTRQRASVARCQAGQPMPRLAVCSDGGGGCLIDFPKDGEPVVIDHDSDDRTPISTYAGIVDQKDPSIQHKLSEVSSHVKNELPGIDSIDSFAPSAPIGINTPLVSGLTEAPGPGGAAGAGASGKQAASALAGGLPGGSAGGAAGYAGHLGGIGEGGGDGDLLAGGGADYGRGSSGGSIAIAPGAGGAGGGEVLDDEAEMFAGFLDRHGFSQKKKRKGRAAISQLQGISFGKDKIGPVSQNIFDLPRPQYMKRLTAGEFAAAPQPLSSGGGGGGSGSQ